MCGIAGFSGRGDEQSLEQMIFAIRHRGPDSTGVWMGEGIGLAHARLAIIDLSPAGHQPMWSAQRSAVIVFNGEIYNFADLREECIAKGYQFHGGSDTEVILALYETYGISCIERLRGMFAIALYDLRTKTLYLARDRMGKKPLYYGEVSGTLVFGSEPKSLFGYPGMKKNIDHAALAAYLALDYVPTPLSIYQNIRKLPPASILTHKDGVSSIRTFWEPTGSQNPVLSEQEAIAELERRMYDAVSSRLVADVPLGVFLSGGLDSSTVAYYASRVAKEPIHTFSIGFHEVSFDESIYAEQVAKHLGTDHHHKMLSGEDSLRVIPKVFDLLDEPMADASIIPTYLLSEFTREHVTVALGGDGGDELFAGYQTFQAELIYDYLSSLPRGLGVSLLHQIVPLIPSSNAYMSNEFKLRKFLEGVDEPRMASRHMRWAGTFSEHEIAQILLPEISHAEKVDPFALAESYFSTSRLQDDRNKLLWTYQRTYMMDQVMVKVDRATMYNALEARAPFLDTKVVEFANSLPYSLKLHGVTPKYILKKCMEGKLPRDIIYRTKKGFGVPVGEWLRGPLKEWGEDLLSVTNIEKSGVFSPNYIRSLWSEHQSGQRDHRKKLWNILVFLEWQRHFSSTEEVSR